MPGKNGNHDEVMAAVMGAFIGAVISTLFGFFTALQPLSLVLLFLGVTLAWVLLRSCVRSNLNPTIDRNSLKRIFSSIADRYRWVYASSLLMITVIAFGAWLINPGTVIAGCWHAPAVEAITSQTINPGVQELTLDINRCKEIETHLRRTSRGTVFPIMRHSDVDDEVKFTYRAPASTQAVREWMTVEIEYDAKRPNKNLKRLWWFGMGRQK